MPAQPVFHTVPQEAGWGYIGERADPNWTTPNDVMTWSTLKGGKKKKRVGALPSREAIFQRLGEHQAYLGEMVSGLCITWVFFTSLIKLLLPQPSRVLILIVQFSPIGAGGGTGCEGTLVLAWGHSPQGNSSEVRAPSFLQRGAPALQWSS